MSSFLGNHHLQTRGVAWSHPCGFLHRANQALDDFLRWACVWVSPVLGGQHYSFVCEAAGEIRMPGDLGLHHHRYLLVSRILEKD